MQLSPALGRALRGCLFRADRGRVPAAMLLAFLQRTPALRLLATGAGSLAEAPAGALVKAAAASLAALGAVDSLAGATAYSLSTGMPGHPSPYAVTAGSQIAGVAFSLVSVPLVTNPPESWTLSGSIPPGLQFGVLGDFITSAGSVNATNPTLIGTPTKAGTYTMVLQAWEFQNGTGLFSSTFTYQVTVNAGGGTPPVFTTQPLSVTVTGGTVALNAVASNAVSYQWRLGSAPVAGATGTTLLIGSAAAAQGSYTCVATNASGAATSAAATVGVVSTLDIGRMINLSARAQVGTGANIIFGGFAIGGAGTTGSQPLLIRASGPALIPLGVTGTLPDPQLQLFDSAGTAIPGDLNNGWGGTAQITATAAAVGAFAWHTPSSHDAALDLSLASGPYTAQVSGQKNDTGDALVEVYDATPAGTYTPSMPRLVNLSARVNVGSGAANALFAGFVIRGSTAMTVLIRASGPALVPLGVTGTLADPALQLQNQADGTVIASNTGWGGDPQIAATAASVGAFRWGNPASADSALLITLAPGNYNAVASGAGGDSGVAIVEVYEVP